MASVSETRAGRVEQSMCLNIGSGEDYREGWINLDYNDRYDPDITHNLNDPDGWPFHTDRFNRVAASHIFEHLDDLEFQFNEAARVLVPGGELEVRVPFGLNALTDHTHQHHFTWDTFLQFAQNGEDINDNYQFDPSPPLRLVDRSVKSAVCHGPFKVTSPLFQRFLRKHGPGLWVEDWPGSSGEFVATFEVIG